MSPEIFRDKLIEPKDHLILALDGMPWHEACVILGEIKGQAGAIKIEDMAQPLGFGHAIRRCSAYGFPVLADQKIHRSPVSTLNDVRAIASQSPLFITVHAESSESLISAARGRGQAIDALKEYYVSNSKDPDELETIAGLLGVTALTLQGNRSTKKLLEKAKRIVDAGFVGVVCWPQEVEIIRSNDVTKDTLIIVEGIVQRGYKKPHDQKRLRTLASVIKAGADMVIVGQTILYPPEGMTRVESAQQVVSEIEAVRYKPKGKKQKE